MSYRRPSERQMANEDEVHAALLRFLSEKGAGEKLAKRAGVSSTNISQIKSRDLPMSPEVAFALGFDRVAFWRRQDTTGSPTKPFERNPMTDGASSASAPIGRLLKLSEVANQTSLHRATIYRRIAEGNFPKPIPIGGGRVAWRESDIERWKEDPPVTHPT